VDFRGLRPTFHLGNARVKGDASIQLEYRRVGTHVIPWPTSARGFLYFHRSSSPDIHPAAGSLRFCSVDSPEDLSRAFGTNTGGHASPLVGAQAFDLTVDAGGYDIPWTIPLLTLRRLPKYAAIWQQLKEDGLMTPQQSYYIDQLMQPGPRVTRASLRRQTLEDMRSPWILDLDLVDVGLMVLAEDRVYSLNLRDLTVSQQGRKYLNGKQGRSQIGMDGGFWS
jgi:hypothetical protein